MHPWIKERAYLSKELYHHKERERERVQYVKGMVLNETRHWLHGGQLTSRAYTPQPPHEGCTKDEVINLKGLQSREFTSSTWAWALTGFSAVGQTPYQHWKGKRLQHELWMTICVDAFHRGVAITLITGLGHSFIYQGREHPFQWLKDVLV